MNSKKIIRSVLFFSAITLFLIACTKTDTVTTSTSDRDKFVGTWIATTTGPSGQLNFTLTITASNSAPDQILLRNFDLTGSTAYIAASVSGVNLTMQSTLIGSDRYDGSGSIASSIITFNYTVDDGQTIETRTGTAHK